MIDYAIIGPAIFLKKLNEVGERFAKEMHEGSGTSATQALINFLGGIELLKHMAAAAFTTVVDTTAKESK